MSNQRNVVILGGGFGGIQAALSLSKKLNTLKEKNIYRIVVVDKREYHTFTPLLYEIATTSEEIANDLRLRHFVTYNLKHVLHNEHISVIHDTVLSVNPENRIVYLKNREIPFEYLVIALGSETNYFNIPGLRQHALPLKTFEDAIGIRNTIEEKMKKQDKVRIVIAGGGPTGVELAGEIKSWGSKLTGELYKQCGIEVTLVDGGATILPMLHKKTAKKATKRLRKLGIMVVMGKRIAEIKEKEIIMDTKDSLPYDICIWTGGVKAMELKESLSLQYEKQGRIKISEALQCVFQQKYNNNIYAIGDIACAYDPKTGVPTSLMARPAITQGKIVAKNIIEKIKHGEKAKQHSYVFRNYPYIIPIGGKYAIAKIGPITISGILAWIFKGIVELEYFLSILPFSQAIRMWFRGFLIFIRNDRLG